MPDEPCIWITTSNTLVFFYVDDFIVGGPTANQLQSTLDDISSCFEIRSTGFPHTFLGIQIDKMENGFGIHQTTYITRQMDKHDISIVSITDTRIPMLSEPPTSTNTASPGLIKRMQQLVSILLYTVVNTRPDITKAVQLLAQHTRNPSLKHIDACISVFVYLTTNPKRIEYTSGNLTSASNASFSDAPSRRSSEGVIVFLSNGPIY
jgi:hypothetical protein